MTIPATELPVRPTAAYRLRPGFHLLNSDENWLLYRPDDRFARLKIAPELSAAAAAVLAGEPAPANGVEADELAELLERLVAEGVAETSAAKSPTQRVGGRVTIQGDDGDSVSRLLTEILTSAGCVVRHGDGDIDSASEEPETDVWVSCAGWLPDIRFRERDAWCFEHGVAWHGYYAEGDRFHLGPFWLPEDPRTVRYVDVRARRLAAAVHPEGLEAYWRYVETDRRAEAPVPPNPAEAALIAGALAADVLGRWQGTEPPSHGHQLAYDRSTGRWRRHPVLPVPRGLMTESMP